MRLTLSQKCCRITLHSQDEKRITADVDLLITMREFTELPVSRLSTHDTVRLLRLGVLNGIAPHRGFDPTAILPVTTSKFLRHAAPLRQKAALKGNLEKIIVSALRPFKWLQCYTPEIRRCLFNATPHMVQPPVGERDDFHWCPCSAVTAWTSHGPTGRSQRKQAAIGAHPSLPASVNLTGRLISNFAYIQHVRARNCRRN